jgi:hypothetical protein
MNPYTWKTVIPLPRSYVHPQGFTFNTQQWALVENYTIMVIDGDREFLESLLCAF